MRFSFKWYYLFISATVVGDPHNLLYINTIRTGRNTNNSVQMKDNQYNKRKALSFPR